VPGERHSLSRLLSMSMLLSCVSNPADLGHLMYLQS